jgi:arabinofuranosyltransferase
MTEKTTRALLVGAAVVVFGYVLLRTAWQSDDAYITFRAVENLVKGFGPQWNPDERVQAFTHALWFLLVSACRAVTGEVYYTVYALSIGLSLAAIVLVLRKLTTSIAVGIAVIVALVGSRAFIDYSTSGLENPLTNLLLAIFFIVFGRESDVPTPGRLGRLVLVASLLLTNRLDSGLIVLPVLAVEAWRLKQRAFAPVAIGALPFVAWEVFSLVYFGFPVPNTVYAKLPPNLTLMDLAPQGWFYIKDSIATDPLTLPVIGVAILVPILTRRWRDLPLACGLLLSTLFVIRVGGDFMSGRFFNTPCFAAVALLSRYELPRAAVLRAVPAVAALVASLFTPFPPLLSTGAFDGRSESASGITDERRYYYQNSGLLRDKNTGQPIVTRRQAHVERALARGLFVASTTAIGYAGHFAGRRLHILDPVGLSDPLIARLPTAVPWRIGHFQRADVPGYGDTLATGRNQIQDPGVAAYYDKIVRVTRGPIWSSARWVAIAELNLGRATYLIESYSRGYLGVRASAARGYRPDEADRDPNAVTPFDQGLTLFLDRPQTMRKVEFKLDGQHDYAVVYLLKGREKHAADLAASPSAVAGLVDLQQAIPESVGEVDQIRIIRRRGDGPCTIALWRMLE